VRRSFSEVGSLKGEAGNSFYKLYIDIYIDIYIPIDYISHRKTIQEFKIGFLYFFKFEICIRLD